MTVPTTPQSGFQEYLYYSATTIGSGSAPSWQPIGIVGDVNATRSVTRNELKVRAAGGETVVVRGMKKNGLSFQIPTIKGNAVYTALQAAYEAGTMLAFARAPEPMGSGVNYIAFDGQVNKFDEAEPIDGVNMTSVEVDVALSPNQASTSTTLPFIKTAAYTAS